MRIPPFLLAISAPLIVLSAHVVSAQVAPPNAAAQNAVAPNAAPAAPVEPIAKVDRWEKSIASFEAADGKAPPPQNALLFIGSSSIVGWKTLATDFPNHASINRGFGGSELADSVRYAPRIVWPYKPCMVLLYAGDNDLAAGKTPQKVESDWIEFVRVAREKLPDTPIAFIAIKPSPSRVKLMPKALETNTRIKSWIAAHPDDKVLYIDIWNPMLNADGQPRAELFGKDMLHMNREGYKLWTQIVAPFLPQTEAAGR